MSTNVMYKEYLIKQSVVKPDKPTIEGGSNQLLDFFNSDYVIEKDEEDLTDFFNHLEFEK